MSSLLELMGLTLEAHRPRNGPCSTNGHRRFFVRIGTLKAKKKRKSPLSITSTCTTNSRQYKVEGSDAFYDTIKIEGNPPGDKCSVDVFELYWADLSRRAYGVFQGFIELYDTLFFLCSLGRKTLDFVRGAHPKVLSWQFFGFAQVMAERVLVLAVPIINLCLLAIASCSVAGVVWANPDRHLSVTKFVRYADLPRCAGW